MQIGLTGATGLLGRAAIPKLTAAGHSVIAFSRNPDRPVDGTVETRRLSLETAPDLGDLDALIHLAGEPIFGFWTKSKKRRLRESRIDLTCHLVDAIAAASQKPSTLISASGVSYYGDGGDALLDETSRKGHGYLADLAHDWESEAGRASEFGVRTVFPRFGAVLGLDGGMFPIVRRLFGMCLGGRLSSGHQWMSWVHLDDAVSLLCAAIENDGYAGPVNVTSPEPVTNREFTEAFAKALQRPAFLPVPAFAMKLVLRGLSDVALQSQRCKPAAAEAQGFEFAFRDIRSAIDDLLAKEPSC